MEQQTNSTAVVTTEQNQVTLELLGDYLKTLTNQLNDAQRKQFVAVAQAFGLNPFKREIYAVTFKNKDGGTDLSIVTGYEVYLKRAELNPNFDGYEVTFDGSLSRKNVTKKGKFGDYTETVVEPDGDFSCTCTVYRKDRNHPTVEQVFFDEFVQNNSMWKTKPRLMLKKVAIANAFRKAFPVEFGGMPYTSDELPDNMTGADSLNQQGLTEVKTEQPAIQQAAPAKKPGHDCTDPKAQLLAAVKNYTTRQFAGMLKMFETQDASAHARIVSWLKENGWDKPNMVPADRYAEVVERFYSDEGEAEYNG